MRPLRSRSCDPIVRLMLPNEEEAVIEIDHSAFDDWLMKHTLHAMATAHGAVAYCAEVDRAIAAYMIIKLQTYSVQIQRMAVAKEFQRRGIGTRLFNYACERLTPKRSRCWLDVPATEKNAHLCLQACGFRAINTWRGRKFNGTTERYRFARHYAGPKLYGAKFDWIIFDRLE